MNPKFSKSIELQYYFEAVQKIKIEVFDIDNANMSLTDADFLGAAFIVKQH